MSDRVCIRGCAQQHVHLAVCERSGPEWQGQDGACRGCAPVECREGSLICDRCFGRMRGLLRDAPDLLGRLLSLADPMRATPLDQVRVQSSSTEAPAPVDADLLDAITSIRPVVSWAGWGDLSWASNRLETIEWLVDMVLERHALFDDVRTTWSLQDAVDKWGVERVDRNEVPYEDDDYRGEVVESVPEWGDRLLSREEAEGLAGSAQTLRRWRSAGDVAPVGQIHIAGVKTSLYRRSDVLAVRERMQGRMRSGQSNGGES